MQPGEELYREWLKKCTSYKDVTDWLARNFIYSQARLYLSQLRVKQKLFRLTSFYPWETFILKSGICFDASVFCKYSLNEIDKSYQAELIYILIEKDVMSHYTCGFFLDSKLFVADYGTTCLTTKGTSGPFSSLDEYVNDFFLKRHTSFNKAQAYHFGWPAWRKCTEIF
jgi:hypothetical protein